MKTLKLTLIYALGFPAIGLIGVLQLPLVALCWFGVFVKNDRLQRFCRQVSEATLDPVIDFFGRLEMRVIGEVRP